MEDPSEVIEVKCEIIEISDEENFNCTECDAAFYRKADLDRHQKIHTGEKNYTCEFCPKSFVQKNNLVMHVKMHIGDRRFECDVCNKKFITNSKLVQHYKRHTKEKTKKGRTFMMMPDDDSIISDRN
ncbi:Zinc finger protein 32 [Operophtera brumata]|uniref:Zinc finger protein 32 n=1 Tax=Operophtera brumata TaxID=104452 RepID=A0A0L7L2N0_OPEBR|nr:Zinc finger protein 32 [Operophtera brumata]